MSITMEQALNSSEFHQEPTPFATGRSCTSKQGPIRWRRNGKTKTWVRKPTAFRIPVKWGLRSYDYIDGDTADEATTQYIHAIENCPITLAAQEADEHGHPTWSHLTAHGPCTIPSSFDTEVKVH